MKAAKELFKKFLRDDAFRNEILEEMEEKRDAGAKDPAGALADVATELHYKVSAGQAAAFFVQVSANPDELTDDDLEEIAGECTVDDLPSGWDPDALFADKAVEEPELLSAEKLLDGFEDAVRFGMAGLGITWQQLTNLRRTGRIEG
ncbi:MAG: hypothetical protein Q4D34_07175 [Eggerthellaceae bacterium]|nr:hypothetical protein [Eggerthellaceae bacterium]